MQEILIKKLYEYIRENNPDLLITLQQENKVTDYLHGSMLTVDAMLNQLLAENKPPYIIEEQCMDLLTQPLRPSKFNFLKAILEENFKDNYEGFNQSGILTTELINMIAVCNRVFDELGFSEDEDNKHYLRYAVIGALDEYINVVEESVKR